MTFLKKSYYFKNDPRKLMYINEIEFLKDRKLEALILDINWLSLRLKQEYSKVIPLAEKIISRINVLVIDKYIRWWTENEHTLKMF